MESEANRNDVGRKSHHLIPILVATAGVALLAYMILVEDEPGFIPLLLIVLGVGWYIVERVRSHSH